MRSEPPPPSRGRGSGCGSASERRDAEQRSALWHLGSSFRINRQADRIGRMDTWSPLGPHTSSVKRLTHVRLSRLASSRKACTWRSLERFHCNALQQSLILLQDWLQRKGVKSCSSKALINRLFLVIFIVLQH